MFKVVVSDNRQGDYSLEAKILSGVADLKVLNCATVQDMIDNCADVDGILLDMAPANAEVIGALKNCMVISRYGVGYDNVDVAACTQKKIYVANVPDYCAYDVSDMALALLFACQRQVVSRDKQIREGKWNLRFPHTHRIQGKVLSVLGFGRISRALVKKVSGFELSEVLVYDPYIDEKTIASCGARKVSLEEALQKADYLSLHMPLNNETRGMINESTIAQIKNSVIIINTSRGPLVNDAALIDALKTGKIAYAGLDTHNLEPLPKDSEYFKLDNCILTDHTSYNTMEALEDLKTKVALNVKEVLEGNKPLYHINQF